MEIQVRMLRAVTLGAALAGLAGAAGATSLPFSTSEFGEYLIGMGPVNDSGPGGPNLASAVPPLPSGIEPVPQGITNDGNVAITHEDGVFNFQDVGSTPTAASTAGATTSSSRTRIS